MALGSGMAAILAQRELWYSYSARMGEDGIALEAKGKVEGTSTERLNGQCRVGGSSPNSVTTNHNASTSTSASPLTSSSLQQYRIIEHCTIDLLSR